MVGSAVVLLMGFAQAPGPHRPEHPVLPQFYRPPTYGPQLADVWTRATVESIGSEGGTLTMPVPSDYSGQIVVGFRVDCVPPEAVRGWKWVDRSDGLNRDLEVSVAPGAAGAKITATARVLTPGEDVFRTQRKDFASWRSPTRLVPAGLPPITSLAKRLAEGAGEREKFVDNVAMWVAKAKAGVDGTPFRLVGSPQIDSCARARLCAAILRNRGVPARIVAYAPTWADGIEAAFWLIQYESEEGSWQVIDPTVGIVEPSRDTLIVEAICSLADEDSASPAGRPRRSGVEVSPGVRLAGPDATATGVTLIRDYSWQSAGRLMTGAASRGELVAQSASAGKAEWFNEATFKRVLAGGPTNLALFLGGRPTFPGHN